MGEKTRVTGLEEITGLRNLSAIAEAHVFLLLGGGGWGGACMWLDGHAMENGLKFYQQLE